MANIQLPDFITAENELDGNEPVYIAQGGKTRKTFMQKVKDFIIGTTALTTNDKTVTGSIQELKGKVDANTTSLSERVKKSTVNITYYVNASTGVDTNDGLTSGTAFKTIQATINKLPQIINHAVIINVASGTYNEILSIPGFDGSGTITLNGGADLTTALNYIITSLSVVSCSIPITINGFTSNSTSGNGFYSNGNIRCTFNYCNDIVNATSKVGFYSLHSILVIANCQVSNKNSAITADKSIVFSYSNSGAGNTIGLYSINASTLGKGGTQPSGTTAETTMNGGAIR